MLSLSRASITVLPVLLASLAPAVARAQPPPEPGRSADRATLAEALFERGKALMADRRYDEACPKLAESQRIDPGGGTLLTLALCHERQGKTATAWTELKEAFARAESDGETDRATVAKQHADALHAKLSRLALRVDPSLADAPGLSLTRDGIALGRAAWDLPAPVDPGDHDIEVTATGKRPWSARVRVGPDGDLAHVDVPPLVDVAAAELPAPIRPRATAPRTVAAISLGAFGAVSIGVGAGFGIRALVLQASADKACPTSTCTDPGALHANASARTSAWVADVALPLGVAAGAVSIALFATAPKPVTAWRGGWSVAVAPRPDGLAWVRRTF
jgi:hypothetical protein